MVMVANTDKGRMISLCGSGIDVFEQRSADEQTAILNALQRFKDGSKVELLTPKSSVLGPQLTAMLAERTGPFNPKKFFKTRPGLYVGDSYTSRVLSEAQTLPARPGMTISYRPLVGPANDAKIIQDLPQGHIFANASVLCDCIAGMIDQQKNAEEGPLLNNGSANIFHYYDKNGGVSAVRVRWLSGDRRWRVGAFGLGDSQWSAGSRVFSATAGS